MMVLVVVLPWVVAADKPFSSKVAWWIVVGLWYYHRLEMGSLLGCAR